jgi:phosphoribosylglycinamide formyltransferase-1
MKSIVILISGRGSNMESLLDAVATGALPVRVAAVFSNREAAKGLQTAIAKGIATRVVDDREFASREVFDAALAEAIDAFSPDLVVLAGFMRLLSECFVRRFAGRLINIHPSLLPSFPGLHAHRRALAEGVRVHGCTVHFVTAALDHGPIIVQAAVPVIDGDDEASLAARVLAQEHQIYPLAVRWFAEGRLRLAGERVELIESIDFAAAQDGAGVLISPLPRRS